MSYPERKPIYDTYKEIVSIIIKNKTNKSYAEAEIEDLTQSLLQAFNDIKNSLLLNRKWIDE